MVLAQKRDQRDTWLQFILCTAIGQGVAYKLGQPDNVTIAISAILTLYADRGPAGYRVYVRKRIWAQVVMGAVVIGIAQVVTGLVGTAGGLYVWGTATAAVAVAVLFQYRFSIAPLTVSAGNAVLIMTAGIEREAPVSFYLYRVISCCAGCFLALGVVWAFSLFRSKRRELLAQLRHDGQALLDAANAQDASFPQAANGTYVEKQLDHLAQDKKNRRGAPLLRAAWEAQTQLSALLVLAQGRHGGGLPAEGPAWGEWFHRLCGVHQALLRGEQDAVIPQAPQLPHRELSLDDMRWLVGLHDYQQALRSWSEQAERLPGDTAASTEYGILEKNRGGTP